MDQANICLIHFYKRVSHLSLLSSTCHDGQSSQSRGTAQAPHVRLLPVDERDWQDQCQGEEPRRLHHRGFQEVRRGAESSRRRKQEEVREDAAGGEGEVRGRHEGVVGERRRGSHEAGEEGDASKKKYEKMQQVAKEKFEVDMKEWLENGGEEAMRQAKKE